MSVTEEKKNILDRIDTPADLKALSEKELDSLAAEPLHQETVAWAEAGILPQTLALWS